MVSDPFLVGVFFGFVPGMGFLYLLLREFQSFYQEKRLFRVFFLGMGVGLVVSIVELVTGPRAAAIEAGHPGALALYAGLFGLLEAGAFAVILNWRAFRGKRDTPFYGVGYGLGFGATSVLFLVGNLVANLQGQTRGLAEVVFVAILGLFFVGSLLAHAFIGGLVGRGAAQGPLPPAVGTAILVRGLYVAGFYGMFRLTSPILSIGIPFLAAGAGVFLAVRTLALLRGVVPPEILREMDIHKRRLAREVARDAPGGPPQEPPNG